MSKRPPIHTTYDIGYGKPPEGHRFKSGQSGNLQGRKKKHFRSVAISAFDELNRIVTVKEGKTSSRLPIGAVLAKRLVAEAAKGNTRALQITLNLFASLPEEYQDQNFMREKQKMAIDLVTSLLDRFGHSALKHSDPKANKETDNMNGTGDD